MFNLKNLKFIWVKFAIHNHKNKQRVIKKRALPIEINLDKTQVLKQSPANQR